MNARQRIRRNLQRMAPSELQQLRDELELKLAERRYVDDQEQAVLYLTWSKVLTELAIRAQLQLDL